MSAALRNGRFKWIVGSLALIAGIVAYLLFLAVGGLNDCDVAVHKSIPAPDGKMSAVVFEKECGATVPFNTQVSVASADKPFSPQKNPAFLVLSGRHDLVINWSGEKRLEVTVPRGEQIFRNESRVEGVTVEYR
jgi:hypothetical protein